MADDADSTGAPVGRRPGARVPPTHARTDRQSAGRSVETAPESLYLWQIAVLNTRVETLRGHVDQREQDLQHVIDHYERVLDERRTARDSELLTDGGVRTSARATVSLGADGAGPSDIETAVEWPTPDEGGERAPPAESETGPSGGVGSRVRRLARRALDGLGGLFE